MSTSGLKVLVTGVNGYIGSHTAKALSEHGFTVDGIDNKTHKMNKPRKYLRYYENIDITDYNNDKWYSLKHGAGRYDVVVHLAGLISVEESTKIPTKYFEVNTKATEHLLEYIEPNNFIYASTAAAFDPVSPYAQSKLMSENIIREKAYNNTIFRFFNVAGNDGEFGQVGEATHLIRIAAETAAGKRSSMKLYGTDWNTPDGTCIRDYIHVQDLVDSIVKAVYNPLNTEYECLGRGKGVSCKEVIEMMREVSNVNFRVVETGRRPGDVERLVVDKPSQLLECKRNLFDMCRSAYELELKR